MKIKINNKTMNLKSVWMENQVIKFIDQRKLPFNLEIFEANNYKDVCYAISKMVVRGAPAIGVTAAYGIAQASEQNKNLEIVVKQIKKTRPTANDLFYAVDYMQNAIEKGKNAILASKAYANEIVEKCKKIGINGEKLIKDGFKILTHCNAGALATVDYGTALSPLRFAKNNKKEIFVFVDETRPRLQGMLTAWELLQEGINHAVIADNAAGHFMKNGDIDIVIVGADRIAKNGDTANKIGTYEKACLAKENKIPFFVAAPVSTFDFSIENGNEIPIEERNPDEVLSLGNHRIAPKVTIAKNPAFDVTPAKYITGYITEKGIFKANELKNKNRNNRKIY